MSTIDMSNITECKIGSLGAALTDIDKIILNGTEVWSANAPSWDTRGLDYNSWWDIFTYIINGQLSSVAHVGEVKRVVLSDDSILNMQLVSINDGSGPAGEYYRPYTADFVARNIVATLSITGNSWEDCNLRSYLNTTFFNMLPSELQYVIGQKELYRNTASGNLSYTEDMIWIPTTYELTGNTSGIDMSSYNIKYPEFISSDDRKRYNNQYIATDYWTSSPSNYSNDWNAISANGNSTEFLKSISIGIIPGFRIG